MHISETASNVIAFDRPALLSAVAVETPTGLDEIAANVRAHSRTSTISILAIGKLLFQAKAQLAHGELARWVDQACGFTMRSAQNYMLAWKLAEREGETVSHLNPGALYRLAASATPTIVIQEVVCSIKNGHVPTECEIEALIAHHGDPQPDANSHPVEDELLRELARSLNERLGKDLTVKLVKSPWPVLRKHLREALA